MFGCIISLRIFVGTLAAVVLGSYVDRAHLNQSEAKIDLRMKDKSEYHASRLQRPIHKSTSAE